MYLMKDIVINNITYSTPSRGYTTHKQHVYAYSEMKKSFDACCDSADKSRNPRFDYGEVRHGLCWLCVVQKSSLLAADL